MADVIRHVPPAIDILELGLVDSAGHHELLPIDLGVIRLETIEVWNATRVRGEPITSLVTGGFEVAYEASNTVLGVTGTGGTTSLGLGVAAGTSPSITGLSSGAYQIAYQASGSSQLWLAGASTGSLGFVVAPGTSPSIAMRPTGGYDLVYQTTTGVLSSVGTTGTGNLNLSIASGTGPVAN